MHRDKTLIKKPFVDSGYWTDDFPGKEECIEGKCFSFTAIVKNEQTQSAMKQLQAYICANWWPQEELGDIEGRLMEQNQGKIEKKEMKQISVMAKGLNAGDSQSTSSLTTSSWTRLHLQTTDTQAIFETLRFTVWNRS